MTFANAHGWAVDGLPLRPKEGEAVVLVRRPLEAGDTMHLACQQISIQRLLSRTDSFGQWYCMQLLSETVDVLIRDLLNSIDDPTLTIIAGLKEVQKHLVKQSGSIRLIIIAQNLEIEPDSHMAHLLLYIIRLCHIAHVPVVFSMTRGQLGRALRLRSATCIAVKHNDRPMDVLQEIETVALQLRSAWIDQFTLPLINPLNDRGESPLWIAAYFGYFSFDLYQSCLRYHSCNQQDGVLGMTPLMVAIHRGHGEVAHLLFDAIQKHNLSFSLTGNVHQQKQSLDLTLKSFRGDTLIHLCIPSYPQLLYRLLVDHLSCLNTLVDINDSIQETPLFKACCMQPTSKQSAWPGLPGWPSMTDRDQCVYILVYFNADPWLKNGTMTEEPRNSVKAYCSSSSVSRTIIELFMEKCFDRSPHTDAMLTARRHCKNLLQLL